MAIAIRMAQTTWEGPLASGTGVIRMGSGAAGELAVTWASRTGRADGKTSPEELAAAAHSACYAMALALRLGEHEAAPERLAVDATVTLDEAGGVPTVVSSHLDVTARVPGLGKARFDAVVGEAALSLALGVRQICRGQSVSAGSGPVLVVHAATRQKHAGQRSAGGSCRSGAARLSAPSQPDRHYLSCLVSKMILVTYKSDVHPLALLALGTVIAT
jgi:osmotically inducible protein OsmC